MFEYYHVNLSTASTRSKILLAGALLRLQLSAVLGVGSFAKL